MISDTIAPTTATATDRPPGFELLFDAAPAPMLLLDRDTLKFRAVNEAALAFYGYSREEFLQMRLPDIRPEQIQGEIEGMIARFDDPSLPERPRLHLTKSGERRIVKVHARLFDFGGTQTILASIFDMTHEVKIERELRRVRSFLKNMVDHIPAAIFAKDAASGQYVFFNTAAETLFGRTQAEVIGTTSIGLYDRDTALKFAEHDNQARAAGAAGIVVEETLRGDDGKVRHVRIRKVVVTDGDVDEKTYILGVAEDVTEERVQHMHVAHLAAHDALTGLANRRAFEQKLDARAHQTCALGSNIAVHYIDLDGFKAVNDVHGHPAGDEILKIAAKRMVALVRDTDIVARLGGDEFAVLQLSVKGAESAEALAKRLVEHLSQPYKVGELLLDVGASVGVFLAPAEFPSSTLIQQADQSLYAAKRQGKRRYVYQSFEGAGL